MIERRVVQAIMNADLLAFIEHHRLSELYMEPEFLLNLASSPARVIDLWQDGERALAGVVIDTCENATNAAEFVALASARRDIPEDLLSAALAAAEAEAAQTTYDSMEIGIEGALRPWEPFLQARGYGQSYVMTRMKRHDASNAAIPLAAGWRWIDLASETVLPARRMLMQAFAGIPGMNFRQENNIEDDRDWKTTPPVRLLFADEELAGYVSVLLEPDGSGLVNAIARHPRCRGQGIGAVLLDEALRILAEHDRRPIRLNVAAKNGQALELYQRYGFAAEYAVPIYSIKLRQPQAMS
jgi:ribosomal protein S18 acetylase RimI-like enzyme